MTTIVWKPAVIKEQWLCGPSHTVTHWFCPSSVPLLSPEDAVCTHSAFSPSCLHLPVWSSSSPRWSLRSSVGHPALPSPAHGLLFFLLSTLTCQVEILASVLWLLGPATLWPPHVILTLFLPECCSVFRVTARSQPFTKPVPWIAERLWAHRLSCLI